MGELALSGDIVVYLMGLAATWGAVMWRIAALEKKVEKHNNLIERVAKLEASAKSMHHRLDEIKGGH